MLNRLAVRTPASTVATQTREVGAEANPEKTLKSPDSNQIRAARALLGVVEFASATTFVVSAATVATAPWWLDAIPAVGTVGDLAQSAVVAVVAGVTFGLAAKARDDL